MGRDRAGRCWSRTDRHLSGELCSAPAGTRAFGETSHLETGGGAPVFVAFAQQQPNEPFRPEIPKTWDDAAVASLEMPLAVPEASPVQIDSSSYYKLPVRAIYKSYPVYHPNKEPAGYFEWLERQEPENAFDPSLLKTKEDWIRAGELVFDAPKRLRSTPTTSSHLLRDSSHRQITLENSTSRRFRSEPIRI
jgi:hypothetical protein